MGGRWIAFALALTAFAQIRIEPLIELERETRDPSLSPDGKTLVFEWIRPDYSFGLYSRALAGGDPQPFIASKDFDGGPGDPRWSPDGTKIAFTRFYSHWESHLVVRNKDGGSEQDLGNVCLGGFSWAADGRFLIASQQPEPDVCKLSVYSVETGRVVRRLAERGECPALSPDGRTLSFCDKGALGVIPLDPHLLPTGSPLTITREPRGIGNIVWTPDGKSLLYRTERDGPELRRIEARAGAKPVALGSTAANLQISQFLPDGSAVATETTQAAGLWRINLGENPLTITPAEERDCSGGGVGCSPDGRTRVFISRRTGTDQIFLANADGSNERLLVPRIPPLKNPTDEAVPSIAGWSPDGKWIAFTTFAAHGNADGRSWLYVVSAGGGPLRRLAEEAYAISGPSWSRDSRSIYAWRSWDTEDQRHDLKDDPIVRIDVLNGKLSNLGEAKGMWPKESANGKFVYYFTSPYPKLTRIALATGKIEQLRDRDDLGFFTYNLSDHDLYLFEPVGRGNLHEYLVRFDPDTRSLTRLIEVPFRPRGAHLSPDSKSLFIEQADDPKTRVVRVFGLR